MLWFKIWYTPKLDATFLIEVDDTGGNVLSSDKKHDMDRWCIPCIARKIAMIHVTPMLMVDYHYSQVLSLLPSHFRQWLGMV